VTSDKSRILFVDGVPRGRTPMILRVAPGPHRVSALGLSATSVIATVGDTVGVRLAAPQP
jgi:hypothetical protein